MLLNVAVPEPTEINLFSSLYNERCENALPPFLNYCKVRHMNEQMYLSDLVSLQIRLVWSKKECWQKFHHPHIQPWCKLLETLTCLCSLFKKTTLEKKKWVCAAASQKRIILWLSYEEELNLLVLPTCAKCVSQLAPSVNRCSVAGEKGERASLQFACLSLVMGFDRRFAVLCDTF